MSAMGDVVMTVPVVSAFAKQHPEMQITMLTNPRFGGMFPEQANVEIFGADTKKDYKGFWGILKLFKALNAHRHFDMVIDLHDVLRSKVLRTLFRLKGTPCFSIEKGRSEKKALTQANGKVLKQLKTSIERYRDVFTEAGFEVLLNYARPSAPLSDEISAVTGKKEGKWLAIAPFAQHKGKIYPLDLMEKVVEHFAKKEGYKVLLFGGGKQEKEILEGWEARFENVISLAGKFPLKAELAILENADVMISMDSSNMHLASMVGTRVISIWGATHPYAGFYGYGQKEEDAVQLDMPCRPCSIYGNKPCLHDNFECLRGIKPEIIIEKVEHAMNDMNDLG